MASFLHHMRAMVGGRWLGWGMVVALGCASVAALWLLAAVALGRSRRKPLVATTASSALTVALCGIRVELEYGEATRLLLGEVRAPDPSERARLTSESVSRLINTLVFPPLPLIAIALLVAFSLLWRRDRTWPHCVGAVAALLVATTAWSVLRAQGAFFTGFGCGQECLYDVLLQSRTDLHLGKLYLGAAAALGWVWLLVVARRLGDWGRRSILVASSLLLLTGLIATVAARGRYYDTWHLVPFDASPMPCMVRSDRLESLPVASPHCQGIDAPMFEVWPDGAFIDGTPMATPEDVRVKLDEKRKLWLMLNPGREFAGHVVLVAPQRASVSELSSWVTAAHAAGYEKVGLYSRAPELQLHTATLGVIREPRCCVAPLVLGDTLATPLIQR